MSMFDHPKQMHALGVRGVINMCDEYAGPMNDYMKLGITQLRLPTIDHFEPKTEHIQQAMDFIQAHRVKGQKVYVHCKAGHGRAAAVALCWTINQNPDKTAQELNAMLVKKRHVRKTLYQQRNVMEFVSLTRGPFEKVNVKAAEPPARGDDQ